MFHAEISADGAIANVIPQTTTLSAGPRRPNDMNNTNYVTEKGNASGQKIALSVKKV